MAEKEYSVLVSVRATSEDAAIKQVQKAIEQLGQTTKKTEQATKSQAKATSDLSKTMSGDLVNSVGEVISKYVALTAMIVKVVSYVKETIQMALENERANKQLTESIKIFTGAEEKQAKALQDTIEKLATLTGISEGQAKEGFIKLVALTKDNEQALQLLKIAMGASIQTGTEFATTLDDIARVIRTGTIRDTSAFGSVLYTLAEDGKITKEELQKLNQEFANLSSIGLTTAQKIDILKEKISQTRQEIGEQFRPSIEAFVELLMKWGSNIAIFFLNIYTLVKAVIGVEVDGVVALSSALKEFATLNFKEGIEAFKRGGEVAKEHFIETLDEAKKYRENLNKIWSETKPTDDNKAFVLDIKKTEEGGDRVAEAVKRGVDILDDIIQSFLLKSEQDWNSHWQNKRQTIDETMNDIEHLLLDSNKKIQQEEADFHNALISSEQDYWSDYFDFMQLNRFKELEAEIKFRKKEIDLLKKNGQNTKAIEADLKRFIIMTRLEEAQAVTASLLTMVDTSSKMGKALFRINQALAIAQTIISTREGVGRALEAYPPPTSYIFAGITLAMGMAQVAAIASQKIPSARGGYEVPAGVNPIVQLHEKEVVLPEYISSPLKDFLSSRGEAVTNNYGGNSTIIVNALQGGYAVRNALKAEAKYKRLYSSIRVGE